jgi:hypothetical protein
MKRLLKSSESPHGLILEGKGRNVANSANTANNANNAKFVQREQKP